ncbi:hypothetical protein ACIBF6_41310 [Streptosporangium amethystogenes]|uniref:hypothetical protein n=1 Tax=Streptosporangium amethystogenes TaxID=2002 RepID=UPI00378BFBAD
MAKGVLRHLWEALDFKLSEVLQLDFLLGVAGGVAVLVMAFVEPAALIRSVPVAASLVGVIIGTVLAGVAVQAAFMDQSFLRKLRAIGRDPVYYLAPFLFTGVTGVIGMLTLLVLSAMSANTHIVVLAPFGSVAGFFTVWSLASILQCLAMLVQFVGLKMDAADVPDDVHSSR